MKHLNRLGICKMARYARLSAGTRMGPNEMRDNPIKSELRFR